MADAASDPFVAKARAPRETLITALKSLRCAAFLSAVSATGGMAASLQVTPVSVEVTAPGSASTITLRNMAAHPITAQVRVFRWSQSGQKDVLDPTSDVVVSPPIVEVPAAGEYTVRIVRISKTPVATEESYRLIVDEVPDPRSRSANAVQFALRYSVPVFFSGEGQALPKIEWAIYRNGNQLSVVAQNKGTRRARLSAVQLQLPNNQVIKLSDGLVGYVHGGATMRFPIAKPASSLGSAKSIQVTAQTDVGISSGVAAINPSR